jgi:hypothetical protein
MAKNAVLISVLVFSVTTVCNPGFSQRLSQQYPGFRAKPLATGTLSSLALTSPVMIPASHPWNRQQEQHCGPVQKEVPVAATCRRAENTIPPVHKYMEPARPGNVYSTGMGSAPHHKVQKGSQVPLLMNFEGIANINNSPNPDTDGEAGPQHFVQMVKYSFAIWAKDGTLLYGPASNKTLWNHIPGPWNSLEYYTDPIVVYDHLADRWLMSAMVYDIPLQYYEMIAVSQTADPTGGWNSYVYSFDNMPDYPKFGVWPDGYYMTVNEARIDAGYNSEFAGLTIMVFNREDMIEGDVSPRTLKFHVPATDTGFYSSPSCFLPADLDGTPPPAGTPNYLATIRDDQMGYPEDELWIWKCTVNWDDTIQCNLAQDTILAVEPFTGNINDINANTIRQPNTNYRIFTMGDRLMHRLQYRNFGTHQSLITNHTIQVTPDEHAGIRWYEVRRQGSQWTLHQQGTYCPDDDDRWMGSVSMDVNGNMALGYSVSGQTTYPSIRVTGRKAEDPLHQMTFAETGIMVGTGNQVVNTRWGDYSCMTLDPSNELIFWYTQQYTKTSGPLGWSTRIASFSLDTAMVGIAGRDGANIDFSIFPNPAAGEVSVHITLPEPSPVIIVLSDLSGKSHRLSESGSTLGKGEHTIRVNPSAALSHGPRVNGFAVLTIIACNQSLSKKLILIE